MKAIILLSFCFLSQTISTQITWSEPIFVSPEDFGNFYPRISLSNTNEPLVTWGGVDHVYFSKKDGEAFSAPIKINNDSTKAFVESWTGADFASQGDHIYIGFMHKDWGKKTYFAYSSDGGNSFSAPKLIENYPDSTSRFPTITIDPDGNPIIAVMKMSSDGKSPHYVVRKSNDLGNSFFNESDVGNEVGAAGEACDCCPASITNNGIHTALLYRNNDNNFRDIYCGLSENFGASFENGFPVDNNEWKIFGCPSSGPDGVIIGDTIYSVFMSQSNCYFSKTNILNGKLESIAKLGPDPIKGSQNFPRISHDGNSVAICWKDVFDGQRLIVAYAENITDGSEFVFDTLHQQSFHSADIALVGNEMHVVWQDLSSNQVLYSKGLYNLISDINPEQKNEALLLYPNPATEYIHTNLNELLESYQIINSLGEIVQNGVVRGPISIHTLLHGAYYFIGKMEDGSMIRVPFIKI